MKVEFHIKDVVITAHQKALMEKKLYKLKRYLKDEPMVVDLYLSDESSEEKGGEDQSVEISVVFQSEKIFVREVDSRLMRAFAFAYRSIERKLQEFHQKRIGNSNKPFRHRFKKIFKVFGIEE